jgi:hypothetical protein
MNEYPNGMKTAAEIADYFPGMTEQQILELAESGYMPHYKIGNGPPMFGVTKVKKWVAENMLTEYEGRPISSAIRVVYPAPSPVSEIPTSIQNVPGLQEIPKHHFQPGVYFLCKAWKVVYVGQSVAPSNRICTHKKDRYKDFDSVFLLPVPESDLNNTEGAFIQLLMPSQQGGLRIGRDSPLLPPMTENSNVVIDRIMKTELPDSQPTHQPL